MMEAEAAEVKSTIATVDLSRAKTKAEFWSERMAAAKSRQKEILLHSDEKRWMEWTKVRVESQKLLNLSAAQLAIGEEMKKLQNMYEDYSRKIKIQKSKSKSKRINLGEKATLKRIEKERVIVRETLKLMKDAVDCCGAAVTITGSILHHRIPFLKVEEVELIDIADLSILQRICAYSRCYEGLLLKFCVGKSVEKELMELFGAAVSLEEITMENDRLYQLSVDDRGVYHFEEDGSNKHMFWCQFKPMAEAEAEAKAKAEAMAIEFERAKRKAQFRSELMKNFAEKAENITLQQIERDDSADFKGSCSTIRADSQKLTILSTARSAIERELSRLETSFIIYSVKIHRLRENANANKLRLSIAEKNTAWVVKELKKRFKKEEKELKSTEKEIKEANRKPSGLVYHLLQWLNEKKVDAEDELRCLERRMADEEASLRVLRDEVEENLRSIEAQSMIVKKNVATLEDTLKLRKDALGYCKSAIAMIEQVYLHRILKLKFDDAIASYVELVDITDVNIFQSICICGRSDGRGGVVLRFCVVKDELLEIVATIINKEEFVLKRDRVYELSVDEKGTYNVFELIVEDFKRFYAAGTVNAFDPQTKKHTMKEEADHSSSPFKEVMETTEKKSKRKQQQQRVASSPKRSKGIATASTTTSKEEDRERIVN